MRWQRRGLEHKCLPLALIMATTPAVTPAHKADARYCCVFLPAVVYIIQYQLQPRKSYKIKSLSLP